MKNYTGQVTARGNPVIQSRGKSYQIPQSGFSPALRAQLLSGASQGAIRGTWDAPKRQVVTQRFNALARGQALARTGGGSGGGLNLGNILKDSKTGKVSSSKQFIKTGGFDQANKDFDALVGSAPISVRGGGVRTAITADGTKINVRPKSKRGQATVEVIPPKGKRTKVRYD